VSYFDAYQVIFEVIWPCKCLFIWQNLYMAEAHTGVFRIGTRSLLLNSSYEPMKIISWQKALLLWFQDKVEILEYHNLFARSARAQFQLPSVMRLKSYVRPRSYGAVRFCRENVYIRDNFTCQYCGGKHSPKNLTLDHVIPASKRGPKSWTNVVAACKNCNQKKANHTPQAANMPLLKEPTIPNWLPSPELEMKPGNMPTTWYQYLRFKAG
jgi:5-methylcytosine-specific restriction endonuclease McrA